MRRDRLACVVAILVFLLPFAVSAAEFEPTESYKRQAIEGCDVRVSAAFDEKPDLAAQVLDLLRVRLFEVKRVLPADALAKLRRVTFWVEVDDPKYPGMCFHPSRDWLRANGFNPDKAGGIEIGNARHFLGWADQPAMVLHELAHAYHHLVLGHDNADLRAAYKAAVRSGKYDCVLRASGKNERAYALENADEFFAEMTESYFLTNDFFPFVRAELERHDPDAFALVRRLWGVR